MTQAALSALPAPTETKWTVIRGAMAGSVRLMSPGNFSIGRSAECEFIIANDPKCSRKHAVVTWTRSGYEVQNLAESNAILVNGKEVSRHLLRDGDLLTVGATELQFNLTTQPNSLNIQLRRLAVAPKSVGAHATHIAKKSSKKPMSPLMPVYVVLGLVVLYLLLSDNPTNKKKQLAIRSEQQIQEAIESAEKLRESALLSSSRRSDNTIVQRQAQENYVRGFRDFRKGQFERALDSFNTCLALNPSHLLCTRYKQLSHRKFNELVQLQMVLGRRYRDQNQFKACRAAFRNVMVMLKDASSAAYREAKANYDACYALSEGRF